MYSMAGLPPLVGGAEVYHWAGKPAASSDLSSTRRTYYCYVVRVDCHRFGWQDVGPLVAMLGAELRFPVECVYRPLNDLHQRLSPRRLHAAAAAPGQHADEPRARFRGSRRVADAGVDPEPAPRRRRLPSTRAAVPRVEMGMAYRRHEPSAVLPAFLGDRARRGRA